MPTTLNLIHFNDVYHISPQKREPVGGAARFASVINQNLDKLNMIPEDAWVLFSGDVFSPSIESSLTRGQHMVPVLNQLHIAASLTGNHDFDFGVPNLQKLIKQNNFPWILSNVLDDATGTPPEGMGRWAVLQGEKSGIKIGVLGLVEKEWILTIPSFPPTLKYHPAAEVAHLLSKTLRNPTGPYAVDIVVALTHMRLPNDLKFAQEAAEDVDLVLGGHDHFYYISKSIPLAGPDWSRELNLAAQGGKDPEPGEPNPRVRVVKSGADFRELSLVKVVVGDKDESGRKRIVDVEVTRQEITSSIPEDPSVSAIIKQVSSLVTAKTSRTIGYTRTALDGLFSTVRTRESNLGNLTADLMLHAYASSSCLGQTGIDFAILNGGTLRGDAVLGPGVITLGDVMNFFPFEDPVVVIKITGRNVWAALENALSEYPKQEGRFPQVAGLRVEWNPQREPGNRVRRVFVVHNKKGDDASNSDGTSHHQQGSDSDMEPEATPLDLDKTYVLVTREYMAQGYDGFTPFVTPPEGYLIDGENGMLISALYRRFFLGLKYVNAMRMHFDHECTTHRGVVEAAKTWRHKTRARRLEHEGSESGSETLETETSMTSETEASVSSERKTPENEQHHYEQHHHELTSHSTTIKGIQDALHHSVGGRPCCLKEKHGAMSEDEEDERFKRKCAEALATLQEEKKEEEGGGKGANKDDGKGEVEDDGVKWVRKWASVGPVVEGRIVEVED